MKPPPSPVPKPLGLGAIMLAVLRREIALAMRQKGEVLTPLVFFIVIASLFPLGVGPESALLLRMAPGVLWVSALLAAMLSLQRMFASDYADGSLEQMLLSSTPLALLVAAKALSHFLLSGLPLAMSLGRFVAASPAASASPSIVSAIEQSIIQFYNVDFGNAFANAYLLSMQTVAGAPGGGKTVPPQPPPPPVALPLRPPVATGYEAQQLP